MKNKWIPALLVFALGVLSGYSIAQIHTQAALMQKTGKATVKTINKLAKTLNLSSQQKATVKKILKDNHKDVQDLKAEFGSRYLNIRESVKQNIQTVLNEQQKERFRAITQKADETLLKTMQSGIIDESSDLESNEG